MRTLLIGGSGSGKSTYAEVFASKHMGTRYYIATMQPYDDESMSRIKRHRKMRADKGFFTIERYTDIGGLSLPERGLALLECLCNLTANEMFEPCGAGDRAVRAILDGITVLERQCDELIVVTNDVASDGGKYEDNTMRYIRTLNALNIALAQRFDRVVEMVAGIPILLKGESLL